MKKIWIAVIAVLALATLYAQTMEGERIEVKKRDVLSTIKVPNITKEISHEVYVEETVIKKEENPLSIHVEDDKNTTRDHLVHLTVRAEHVPDAEWCNFWWYEGEKFLGMGETFETTFKQGVHVITVFGQDTLGHERNATMKITAWEYTKKEYLHYSDSTGEFTYKEVKTYDHNEHLILEKGENYRIVYLYNKEGKLVEEQYENELNINLNYTRTYEYDERGNKILSEEFDVNDKTRWYESLSYSEEGYIDTFLMGSDINEANNNIDSSYGGVVYSEDSTYYAEENYEEESKAVLDENGNMLHDEMNFGDSSMILDYQYNENNQTTEKRVSTKGEEYNSTRTTKYSYNDNGEISGMEFMTSYDNSVMCHYSSTISYTKKHQLHQRQTKVLGGNCQYMVENLYEEYKYDEKGEIIESKTKAYLPEKKQEVSEIFTTLKTNSYYSNSLED